MASAGRVPGAAPSGGRLRAVIAAAPLLCCMLVPLVQVGGVAYLYDLVALGAMLLLGLPPARVSAGYRIACCLFLVAFSLSFLSSVARAGVSFRQVGQMAQFFIAIFYSYRCVLQYSRRANRRRCLRAKRRARGLPAWIARRRSVRIVPNEPLAG